MSLACLPGPENVKLNMHTDLLHVILQVRYDRTDGWVETNPI